VAKFSKCRVWDNVHREVPLILEVSEFPDNTNNTVLDTWKAASMPNQLGLSSRFDTIPNCDIQMDRQIDKQTYDDSKYHGCILLPSKKHQRLNNSHPKEMTTYPSKQFHVPCDDCIQIIRVAGSVCRCKLMIRLTEWLAQSQTTTIHKTYTHYHP